MRRIRFGVGKQREFLNLIISRLSSPSLRGVLQFGFKVPYSTLKNYYNESRLLPENLFNDFCEIAEIDKNKLEFQFIDDNWGKVKGGKRRKKQLI